MNLPDGGRGIPANGSPSYVLVNTGGEGGGGGENVVAWTLRVHVPSSVPLEFNHSAFVKYGLMLTNALNGFLFSQ